MAFDRHALFYGRTLAWRLFKRYHTHFNHAFWSHSAAKTFSFSSTRPFNRSDSTDQLFAFAKGNRRVPDTLGAWADAYADFDRWTRMAAVVAIAGYLETFLTQIGTAALESCPSLVFGGGPKIDGAIYLKHNPKYGLYQYAEPLVRGEWQARISAYNRLFGACPFYSELGQLELLRKVRNDAGHSFGRDIKSMQFAGTANVEKLSRLSDRKIHDFLSLIESVATKVENDLAKLVGQYELIKLFHIWLPTRGVIRFNRTELARQFGLHVHELTQNSYGKRRTIELIRYYEKL